MYHLYIITPFVDIEAKNHKFLVSDKQRSSNISSFCLLERVFDNG